MDTPDQHTCEHPDCEAEAIVGVNSHYVCGDHLDWVFQQHVPNPKKFIEEITGGSGTSEAL